MPQTPRALIETLDLHQSVSEETGVNQYDTIQGMTANLNMQVGDRAVIQGSADLWNVAAAGGVALRILIQRPNGQTVTLDLHPVYQARVPENPIIVDVQDVIEVGGTDPVGGYAIFLQFAALKSGVAKCIRGSLSIQHYRPISDPSPAGDNHMVFPDFSGPFATATLPPSGGFTPAQLLPVSAPPGTYAMFMEVGIVGDASGNLLQVRRIGASDAGDVQQLFRVTSPAAPQTKLMLVATTNGSFEYAWSGTVSNASARIVAWVVQS